MLLVVSPVAVGWLYFGRVGLAVCLWLVIAVAVRAMWQDLRGDDLINRQTANSSAIGILPTGTVAVKSGGKALGLQEGAMYQVHDELTFGRSPSCTVRLEDPFASSVHARIVWQPPRYVIEDMGSSNGTFVSNKRIYSPRVLGDGDEVRIGSAEFVFHES